MYVIIDNYDSFTYNLFQYLSALTDSEVRVFRNDRVTVAQLEELQPRGIVISPGPGGPEDAGISIEAVRHFAGRVPLLGVCLGHQVIGHAFGASVVGAGRIVHGKTDRISLDGRGLFRGIPSPSVFTRYHSLVVQRDTLPKEFEVTADAPDGEVMGIRHREWILEGVQFHPESIASDAGMRVLANFLDYRREPFLFRPLLDRVMSGDPSEHGGRRRADGRVTEGRLPGSQLAAVLVALSMKGYATRQEIAGFASVLARKKQRWSAAAWWSTPAAPAATDWPRSTSRRWPRWCTWRAAACRWPSTATDGRQLAHRQCRLLRRPRHRHRADAGTRQRRRPAAAITDNSPSCSLPPTMEAMRHAAVRCARELGNQDRAEPARDRWSTRRRRSTSSSGCTTGRCASRCARGAAATACAGPRGAARTSFVSCILSGAFLRLLPGS